MAATSLSPFLTKRPRQSPELGWPIGSLAEPSPYTFPHILLCFAPTIPQHIIQSSASCLQYYFADLESPHSRVSKVYSGHLLSITNPQFFSPGIKDIIDFTCMSPQMLANKTLFTKSRGHNLILQPCYYLFSIFLISIIYFSCYVVLYSLNIERIFFKAIFLLIVWKFFIQHVLSIHPSH